MSAFFTRIDPHPSLKGYIDKMWLFKTNGYMPAEDMKLVVPNGRLKLSVSFHNSMIAKSNDCFFETKEHVISLTGLVDKPLTLDTGSNAFTATIVIEFSPQYAYRFFTVKMKDVSNQIISLQEVIGSLYREIESRVTEKNTVAEKIEILQSFLIEQLRNSEHDQVLEFCIHNIISSNGRLPVKELEKKTGYSGRWLNMKFEEKLGVSPKNFASIIKFSHFYQSFLNRSEKHFLHNQFYDSYYDQSHFLRAFKRFTGLTPKRFDSNQNEFGRLFHQD